MVPRPQDETTTGVPSSGRMGSSSSSSSSSSYHYGSIEVRNHHDDEEAVPLVGGSDRDPFHNKLGMFCCRCKSKRSTTLTVVVVAVAAFLVAAGVTTHLVFHDHQSNQQGSSGIRYSDHRQHAAGNEKTTSMVLGGSPIAMGVTATDRQEDASPSDIWGNLIGSGTPLPTNSWYLNLVSHRAASAPDDSTSAYTVPYIVDTAPPPHMAGIRVHWPVLQASDRNVQMVDDFKNSVSVGMMSSAGSSSSTSHYTVDDAAPLSHLGVSLKWGGGNGDDENNNNNENDDENNDNHSSSSNNSKSSTMTTHIVRGMPYATVQYAGGALPVLYSYNGLSSSGDGSIQVDGDNGGGDDGGDDASTTTTTTSSTLTCGVTKGEAGPTVSVQRELKLHFINSDFTWIVFFSKPVKVQCDMSEGDEKLRDFTLRVVEYGNNDDNGDNENDDTLTVRLALLDACTTGKSDIQQHCVDRADRKDNLEKYEEVLREHAHVLPTSPQIEFDYPDMSSSSSSSSEFNKETQQQEEARMTIDWGALSTKGGKDDDVKNDDNDSLLMFALPHHQDSLDPDMVTEHCINTFHGSTCLVKGESWKLKESVGPPMSFTAPRPPEADAIPALAEALATDIHYKLSSNLLRAAADTYFSGKILARLGRVIVIASELKQLAAAAGGRRGAPGADLKALYSDVDEASLMASIEAAASASLPSDQDIAAALEQLQKGVQIWLSSKAEALFLWDKSWGGLVNCGCRYVGEGQYGHCDNTFPDCPALEDVNEDFGNGYYNDHHYHYGYHMYAAAVAAKFDPAWGMEHFDEILLYVRDFANPSNEDEFFPQFRNKDWYLGSSWASGIVSAENSPHGRNEESSSEAISAYEGVALFGSAMVDAFGTKSDNDKLAAAKLVRDSGQFLTATEIHATNRYWHVWSSDTHTNTYPKAYTKPVVGMLYDTMASFQTWFAPQALVSYGIQLLPLTPVAERRDDPEWAAELYPLYEKSCEEAGEFCVKNGWSILQAGLLATTGDRKSALKQALAIPTKVFASQGGDGNSLSNTIWYIATRKQIDKSD